MDDLMNKVGALIEEHVKSEVEARRELFETMAQERGKVRKILNAGACEPIEEAAARVARHRDALLVENAHLVDRYSKDEVRRGARALGFWEKLVETLCVGPAEDATFDYVMEKIQALKERSEQLKVAQNDLRNVRVTIQAERDVADKACAERDKYRTMWEQLHRAQGEDLGAQATLKELLSALGLAHFDSATVSEAVRRTHEYDRKQRETIKRLNEEVAASLREHQKTLAKVRELDAKMLEVRKVVAIAP